MMMGSPSCAALARRCWLAAALARSASASFNLPFGDINVVAVTDVHSWVAGHRHEPRFDADYGSVLSFYQRMREECDREGRDLFFVMNGDMNDGTGLGEDPPAQLVPLLKEMPWDAVTIGNHELYKSDFVNFIMQPGGFVEHWGDRYLTANVLNASSGKPLGRTHSFLQGKHGTRLLAFGFLYNMLDHAPVVEVAKVESVVKQQWFREVLSGRSGTFDAVLVLGHMDCHDPSVRVILAAIREVQPSIPVQFITGHSHSRKYARLDAAASSFEPGRYLDTVGFASFPRNASTSTATAGAEAAAEPRRFEHVFIDANLAVLRNVSGLQNFTTPDGGRLTEAIAKTRKHAGLSKRIGCAPRTFNTRANLSRRASLWRLYLEDVVADGLFKRDVTKVFIASAGSLRYNMYMGEVTEDDILTMAPFGDEFWLLGRSVPGSQIAAVLARLNEGHPDADAEEALPEGDREASQKELPEFVSTPFEASGSYELYGGSFDVGSDERPGLLLRALLQLQGGNSTVRPALQFRGENTTTLWHGFVRRSWPCITDRSIVV